MRNLNDILQGVRVEQITGTQEVAVTGICIDSRKAALGSMFIAIKGVSSDGHMFIAKAIELGAKIIVCEALPDKCDIDVTYIVVKDTAAIAGIIASSFYNNPSHSLIVVGITGTNGKTTTATLLYKLYQSFGCKCGLISTVENRINDEVLPSTHTTPDAVSIQELFAEMLKKGCSHVFMEVSSHAIHQQRIAGINFRGAVFTNITHDHLDYHKTFDEYIRVKKSFFDALPPTAFALVNADDKRGMVMLQNTAAEKYAYSLKRPAYIKGKVIENSLSGLLMNIDHHETHFKMIGTFNAYNLLAVYGVAVLLGAEKLEVLIAMSTLTGARGRFETFLSPNDKILGIVDYAHTPDALINVLATIKQLQGDSQQIITVVGCGGDRDRTKRPIMAEVACMHSDKAIFTTDNPRTEDPENILDEMESALTGAMKRKSLRITNRREAIKTACMIASPGDIILLAGKGHETYQEVHGVKYHFDDKEELINAFNILEK